MKAKSLTPHARRPSLILPPLGGDRSQEQAAALLDAHHKLTAAIGDLGALLDEMTPRVVGQETVLLDAAGTASRQFRVPFRCIYVESYSAALLTVVAGPLNTAPNAGVGVAQVKIGGAAVINVRAYAWSVYGGAAGEKVTVTAFAKPQPPYSR